MYPLPKILTLQKVNTGFRVPLMLNAENYRFRVMRQVTQHP